MVEKIGPEVLRLSKLELVLTPRSLTELPMFLVPEPIPLFGGLVSAFVDFLAVLTV